MRRSKMAKALERERLAREWIDRAVVQQTVQLDETKAELEETRRKHRADQRRARSRIRKLEQQKFEVFKIGAKHIRELEERVRQLQAGEAKDRAGKAEAGGRRAERREPAAKARI